MANRSEIIAAVRERRTSVFWFTGWGMIGCIPGQDSLTTVAGAGPEFIDAEIRASMPSEPIIVEGVEGIAATDPFWDGSDTFICDNPSCKLVHSMDENVYQNLRKRIGKPVSPYKRRFKWMSHSHKKRKKQP